MARLFVAVWPPATVLDRLAGLARPQVGGLRWTDRPQWHVTVRFLGWVGDVDLATVALAGMAAGPVEAVLGPAVDRFGGRVLHVPVAGLEAVAAAVSAATAHVGEPPEDRPFAGHLTLARVRRGAAVDLQRLTGIPISGRWPVTEVCLVESRPAVGGAAYRTVGRFPLGTPSH